jgi:hypothetical protein
MMTKGSATSAIAYRNKKGHLALGGGPFKSAEAERCLICWRRLRGIARTVGLSEVRLMI